MMNYLSPYAYRLKTPGWSNDFGSLEKQFETLLADLPKLFDVGNDSILAPQRPQIATRWYESDGAYQVRLDLPGVKRGDIEMTVEDGELSISATRYFGEKKDEQTSEKYQKTIVLPEGVDAEKAGANYEEGVLTLSLPKSEKAKPRRIDVSFK